MFLFIVLSYILSLFYCIPVFAMPATRSTRRTSGSIPSLPVTPLTDADQDLNGLSSLTSKKKANDTRIREILAILAGDAPRNVRPHHMGHPVSRPKLNVGGTRTADAGRWFTMVRIYDPV